MERVGCGPSSIRLPGEPGGGATAGLGYMGRGGGGARLAAGGAGAGRAAGVAHQGPPAADGLRGGLPGRQPADVAVAVAGRQL